MRRRTTKEEKIQIVAEFRDYAKDRLKKAREKQEDLDAPIFGKKFSPRNKIEIAEKMALYLEIPDHAFDLSMFENTSSACIEALADGKLAGIACKYIDPNIHVESIPPKHKKKVVRKMVRGWWFQWIDRPLDLMSWSADDSVTFFDQKITSLTLPRNVEKIKENAFINHEKLREVNGLARYFDDEYCRRMKIEKGAFSGCQLASVILGDATRIEERAFEGCPVQLFSMWKIEDSNQLDSFRELPIKFLEVRNATLPSPLIDSQHPHISSFFDHVCKLTSFVGHPRRRIKCIVISDALKGHILSLPSTPGLSEERKARLNMKAIEKCLFSTRTVGEIINILGMPYKLSTLNRRRQHIFRSQMKRIKKTMPEYAGAIDYAIFKLCKENFSMAPTQGAMENLAGQAGAAFSIFMDKAFVDNFSKLQKYLRSLDSGDSPDSNHGIGNTL